MTTVSLITLSINPFSLITLDFANIDWQASYLLCSFFVACLIIYESIILYRTKGQLPADSWVQSITLLDLIWLVVSGVALYYVYFQPLAKIIPILFIIYNVFGWGYSTYLLKDQLDMDNIEKLEDLIIPKAYIDYSMSFGVVTILAILATCYYLYQHKMLVLATIF